MVGRRAGEARRRPDDHRRVFFRSQQLILPRADAPGQERPADCRGEAGDVSALALSARRTRKQLVPPVDHPS
eukprot:2127296-Prymnesium_polylepis.1